MLGGVSGAVLEGTIGCSVGLLALGLFWVLGIGVCCVPCINFLQHFHGS